MPRRGESAPAAVAAPKPAKKSDVYLCMSMAVSGRSPANGNILSMAAVGITVDREIVGIFSRNLLPLPGSERLVAADVAGYWQTKRAELESVTSSPVSALSAFKDLAKFGKQFGKPTLVGSPLLSVYGWLAYYWSVLLPNTPQPWGFSGLCARSFAAGVFGVSMQSLPKQSDYVADHEGADLDGVPEHDALTSAIVFSNVYRRSQKLPPIPLTWLCARPSMAPSQAAAGDEHGSKPLACEEALVAGGDIPFALYPSISDPNFDSTFTEAVLRHCASPGACDWIVTEKVHGSNFSMITDGYHVRGAKRTSLLSAKDDDAVFFYFSRFLRQHHDQLLQVFAEVRKLHSGARFVSVVGELAGGEYVHPSVPLDLRGAKVQSGVQYHPNNFFYAFDIAYLLHESAAAPSVPLVSSVGDSEVAAGVAPCGGTARWTFLDFDSAHAILTAVGLFCAEPLFRGSAADALRFDPVMLSTIPSRLHLPSIPENYAEGVVVRPVVDIVTGDGARLMAKLKHPKFNEFSRVAGDASPATLLVHFVSNENRVASLESKKSLVERQDMAAMTSSLVDDAVADVAKLHPGFVPTDMQRQAALDAAQQVLTSRRSA